MLSRAPTAEETASPADASELPPLLPALTRLPEVATAGDFLVSLFALPLMLDGRALIIILAVALLVLAAVNPERKH